MPLFPLPLTPFEHYMFADDRPTYPMTFFLRLCVAGQIDRARFRLAVEKALDWHPLLRGCIRGRPEWRTSRLSWHASTAVSPSLTWQPAGTTPAFPHGSPHIDLTCEPGLRLWVFEGAREHTVLIQFHHACCDGLGTIHFLETLLESYAAPERENPSPDWEVLHATRDKFARPAQQRTWQQRLMRLRTMFERVRRYWQAKPAPLAVREPHAKQSPPSGELPALVSEFFSENETESIRCAARKLDISANALLLRDQFVALHEWNQAHSQTTESQLLRVVLPVNLRDGARARTPAFNAISLAFIDRRPGEIADAQQLLRSLHEQVERAKQLRRGMAFLPVLRWLGKIPRGIANRVHQERCLASAVFSNVGLAFAGSPLLGTDRRISSGGWLSLHWRAPRRCGRTRSRAFAR